MQGSPWKRISSVPYKIEGATGVIFDPALWPNSWPGVDEPDVDGNGNVDAGDDV
jgi:hypothetical protein